MAKDLYSILGVNRTATDKEIRTAYRKLARKYHPDVAPNDTGAEARFKEVNAAYEVLSDEDKRKKYDRYGDRWEQAEQIEEAQRRQSAGGWAHHQGMFGGAEGADFGSVFDQLFRRERGPRRGQDFETPIEVSLEEAFQGTTRTVRVAADSGSERRLEVRVPPGVKTGSRVRVAGEGGAGSGGAAAGDIYLVVSVLPHARFERKGDDLLVEIPVNYVDAVLGGEVEVPTIEGRNVILRVPELTQNGRQFRLSGKGMPALGKAGTRGDLLARVRILLPERLSAEERAHFEALRRAHGPVAAEARR
jgi:DnaJ-class molecular chaperone